MRIASLQQLTLARFREFIREPEAVFWTFVFPLLLAGGLALYPAAFDGNFVPDRSPGITAYLRTLPPDTLVVGAPVEADSVPAFSGRNVLTNREYALAYHPGYYQHVEVRTRASEKFETPEDSIRHDKRKVVLRTVRRLVSKHKTAGLRPRIDVVAIVWPPGAPAPSEVRHHRGVMRVERW